MANVQKVISVCTEASSELARVSGDIATLRAQLSNGQQISPELATAINGSIQSALSKFPKFITDLGDVATAADREQMEQPAVPESEEADEQEEKTT